MKPPALSEADRLIQPQPWLIATMLEDGLNIF